MTETPILDRLRARQEQEDRMTAHFEKAEKIAYEESRKAAGWYLEDVLETLPAHNKVLGDCTAYELRQWKEVRDQIDKYLWW